jgi:hypothetical protein
MKTWEKPSYREVCMNAEIGAYQGDPDFAPARARQSDAPEAPRAKAREHAEQPTT